MATGEIQKLREMTGAGVMECKRALDEAKGDFPEAVKFIQERGLAKAEQKAARTAGAGLIETYVHAGRVGVMLQIQAETDFVVRSEPFKVLAHDLAMHIAAMDPADVDTLLAQPYVRDAGMTVGDLVKGVIAKVGENIVVTRFCRYEL